MLHAKPGDLVVEGEPLLTLLTDDVSRIPAGLQALEDAIEVGGTRDTLPLVIDKVTA
jgi:thymidine phosphorylase